MSDPALLDKVVEAVLYEGHILYPYRASARKNRQRFTFGRVYPEIYSAAQKGAEPFVMQTECLLNPTCERPGLEIEVRFLQPMTRQIGRFSDPAGDWTEHREASFELVPELNVDGQRFTAWQEAVEREVRLTKLCPIWDKVSSGAEHAREGIWEESFEFGGGETLEPIRESGGRVEGVIVRRQEAIEGRVEVSAQEVEGGIHQISVRIVNRTPMPGNELENAEAVLMRTFASTHTILRAQGAKFISLMETPVAHKAAAGRCRNVGTWPVLVGNEQRRERDTMLSSPIILYDYPKIAPESAGALFDGTEIDEILTLRILTLSEEEKRELGQTDHLARQLLERTESLSPEQLLRLHGVMREANPFEKEIFGEQQRLEEVTVGGVVLRAGDRVRLRPKAQADVMDLALSGKTAVVESVEQDAENRVHLAVVVEDDPGKDLGFLRLSGHRFFYGPEEVEPIVNS